MTDSQETAPPPAPPAASAADAATRRRLLDGFAQAIREKGLQQTKISDVVRNARASKSTFYECFSGKEECLAALAEDWSETLRLAVDSGVDRDAPWEDQIDAAIDAFVAAITADPAMATAITRELPVISGLPYALWAKDIDLYAAFYMELTRGPMMREAGVRPLSAEMAVILIGGLAELIDRRLRAGNSLAAAAPTMKEATKLLIGPR